MPSKTLSGALAALMEQRGGGARGARLVPLTEVKANGDITTGSGGDSASTFMTNDQPQQAGTQEWVLTADDGTILGLGRGR